MNANPGRPVDLPLGPLMVDLRGPHLLPEERDMLLHPLVGGVILFTRNYETPQQVAALNRELSGLRKPSLLIGVDHEGGDVQRFRQGFTPLPPCAMIGRAYDEDPDRGLQMARDYGWLMASELRAVGVDFSFAPVLDLGTGRSRVIKDRAFHHDPEIIVRLAWATLQGMQTAGMCAVGKHFPGHGSTAADSHHEVPVDERSLAEIEAKDLKPFERLIRKGLAAVMPAHVIYPQVDDRPAGFSSIWLKEILRQRLAFQGVIFSDDICMAGAAVAGGHVERARCALEAGCDMVLVCNDPTAVDLVLEQLNTVEYPLHPDRLLCMHGRPAPEWKELRGSAQWHLVSAMFQSQSGTRRLSENSDCSEGKPD